MVKIKLILAGQDKGTPGGETDGAAAKGAVHLRPHHALCLAFFVGKGYGSEFVAGMAEIERRLAAEPDTPILLVDGTDRICSKCPHNRGGACESAEKTARYDAACLAALGLSAGCAVSWKELSRRVRENILSKPGARERVCPGCRWSSLCRRPSTALCVRAESARGENVKCEMKQKLSKDTGHNKKETEANGE